MHVARTVPDLRRAVTALPRPLALVPTMGALHAGHVALVDEARRRAATCCTSIFVNPLQFGPNEDLARYPRDEAGDLARLDAAGCDLVWMPSVDTMYPPGAVTTVEVGGPTEGFEGAARPGHFRGVATVVLKLLHQAGPDVALFGEKDWQQLQVVRRMAADLDLPVEIAGVPTVREPDGLALSSRNRFLSPAERAAAPRLFAVLRSVAARIAGGEAVADALRFGRDALRDAGLAPDYLDLVDAETMRPQREWRSPARLVAAARLGTVRLLDNVPVP